MADIELVIKIPEEAKIAFDNAESNDLKGGYYDHGGVIGNAIKNGKPLDDVLDKIRAEIDMEKLKDSPNFCIKAHNNAVDIILQIIDKYKAERGDKE